mgnify:CR=1 FL=1
MPSALIADEAPVADATDAVESAATAVPVLSAEIPTEMVSPALAPIWAVAYCTMAHSAVFGDQMPTRSPGPIPRCSSAVAMRRMAS